MGMCCIRGVACPPYKANEFRQEKIELLKDFGITLTESEREIFNTLVIAREIENFVCDIFRNRLN
jgi:hypothetical protein